MAEQATIHPTIADDLLDSLRARDANIGSLLQFISSPIEVRSVVLTTPTRGGDHSSPEYYQWRKAILERDKKTCQECGSQDRVTPHHIEP